MTPKESSPISPTMGVKVVSPFDRSRKKIALPFLPLPRSEMFRMANLSSSVVPTPLKRCGLALSS
jgi:hypothetical protein